MTTYHFDNEEIEESRGNLPDNGVIVEVRDGGIETGSYGFSPDGEGIYWFNSFEEAQEEFLKSNP